MDARDTQRWQQVCEFSFDPPDALWTFADRVAQENGWTAAFTARAIEEYRRFAFLAAVAGHPVAPPSAVDAVWHEHLVFTHNYWDEFCGKTLGRPLHHFPSQGGRGEKRRFADWYAQTRESYRRYFGEPPAEFWPESAGAPAARTALVDLNETWIIPKPRLKRVVPVGAFAAMSLLAGCGALFAVTWNPLDLPGPDFLRFWFALTAGLFLVGGIVRWRQRRVPAAGEDVSPPLDTIDAALLAGGVERATECALGSLFQRGLIRVGDGLSAVGSVPDTLNELERRLFLSMTETPDMSLHACRVVTERVVGARLERLKRRSLLLGDAERSMLRWRVAPWVLSPIALALAKIVVGIHRGRPVGFLVVFGIVATVLAMFLIFAPAERTWKGDAALKRLCREKPKPGRGAGYAPEQVGWSVALYGATLLPALGMASLLEYMKPPSTGGSDSGSSCGSSCGGGGGGGGGCGGCSSS
jgi:uncharacterized protein (TIGR04222 family)